MSNQSCSRCGNSQNLSLVSVPNDKVAAGDEKVQEGRLLVYCARCVNETFPMLYLTIPLELVNYEGLIAIYQSGYTSSDPDTFVNVILGIDEKAASLNGINLENKSALISALEELI